MAESHPLGSSVSRPPVKFSAKDWLCAELIKAAHALDHGRIKELANKERCAYQSKGGFGGGYSQTALHWSARRQDPVALEILLEFSDPNALNGMGRGALGEMCVDVWVAGSGGKSLACARLLLAAGADPRETDMDRISLFHHACMGAMTEVALELLPRIDLGFQSQGWTPLMACAHSGDERLIHEIFHRTKTTLQKKETYPFVGLDAAQIARRVGNHGAAALIESLMQAKDLAMDLGTHSKERAGGPARM